MFSAYELELLPDTTNIPGSILGSDEKRSYWEIQGDNPFSIPLYVKPNRSISLNMELDTAPVEIKYITGNGIFTVMVNDKSSSILGRVLTNDILSMGATISGNINKFHENILALKMISSKNIRIYSIKIKRYFTPLINWFFFICFSILWLFYLFFLVKKVFGF